MSSSSLKLMGLRTFPRRCWRGAATSGGVSRMRYPFEADSLQISMKAFRQSLYQMSSIDKEQWV